MADTDIHHAVTHAIRAVRHGEDRVLFIGPDRRGALLEVVVLDGQTATEPPARHPRYAATAEVPKPPEVTHMPRTREQLEKAAADAERWLDAMDPAELDRPGTDAADLRRIGVALSAVASAETELGHTVRAARGNGRSWGDIAIVLGVSRQAARQRFGEPAVPTQR